MSVSASGSSENLSIDKNRKEEGATKDLKENDSEKLPQFAWMVKPCVFYKEEFSDCKSFKARFHQYFVHGKTIDCNQWGEDYKNCCAWNNKDDMEALRKLSDSERDRAKIRLKAHFGNDVWETRTSPPADWNSELPEHITKEYESSFLKLKADELKSGKISIDDVESNSLFNFDASETTCTIV